MTVMNLKTSEKVEYGVDLDPKMAVICAWRQRDFKDYNTWNYSKYLELVEENKLTFLLNDWSVFKDRRSF